MFFLLLLAACDEVDPPEISPDASIAQPDASIAQPDCAATLGPGTEHAAPIEADETWTADASPHIVTSSINIRGATLTIEPCAVVQIRKGFILTAGGTPGAAPAAIVARGELDREIRFERADPSLPWGSIRAFPTGQIDFEHVRLVGGADPDTATAGGGTIIGAGPGGNTGLTPNVRVVDVTVEGSGGFGVNLQTRGAFTADSRNLTITGSGSFPITVDGAAVSTIPSGTYTGNAVDAIRVANAASLLDPDIAFRARGVPYHLADGFSMSPATSLAAGGLSTLTIDAGVTIKLANGRSFDLGSSNGGLPANIFPVRVIAQGTASEPIVFTSQAATPSAGDWGAIEWHGGPPDGNVMSHVVVEFAGGDAGTQGFGCGQADNDAALIIRNWRPANAFITDSTFASSAAGGIVSGWLTDLDGPSLVANNAFTNIANGCNVSRWRNANNSCPGAAPVCL